MEVFDSLYVFSCTAYLVTPLDLVTVFWQTKCVTKLGLHCTYGNLAKTKKSIQFNANLAQRWSWHFIFYADVFSFLQYSNDPNCRGQMFLRKNGAAVSTGSTSKDDAFQGIFGTAILNLVAGDQVSPFNCMMLNK